MCGVGRALGSTPAVNCSTNLVPTGRTAQSAAKSSIKSEPVMRAICAAVQPNLSAVAFARCRLVTTSRGLQIGHPGRAQSPVRAGGKMALPRKIKVARSRGWTPEIVDLFHVPFDGHAECYVEQLHPNAGAVAHSDGSVSRARGYGPEAEEGC